MKGIECATAGVLAQDVDLVVLRHSVSNGARSAMRGEEAHAQPRKPGPLAKIAETPFEAPTPVFRASNRETDETYGSVVAVLNSGLRVVRGACGLQWVVQRRKNPLIWASFAYCATKEGLLLRLPKDSRGREAWATIAALPAYFPKATAAKAAFAVKLGTKTGERR